MDELIVSLPSGIQALYSSKELHDYANAFLKADVDNSGELDLNELKGVVETLPNDLGDVIPLDDMENMLKLMDLNNVKLDPKLNYFTAMVLADSGSGFRQNILINVGSKDGIKNGWATTDGLGLVGRVTGVGKETSLVMLLTDTSSKLAVVIQPSGEKAIVQGDNTRFPTLELIDKGDLVNAGDRIFTTGDGEVFPKGLLIGRVVRDSNGRERVNLAADYKRLTFLKVMRMTPVESVIESDAIIGEDATDNKETSDDE